MCFPECENKSETESTRAPCGLIFTHAKHENTLKQ